MKHGRHRSLWEDNIKTNLKRNGIGRRAVNSSASE